ncbi:hypothetical protein Rhe02_59590 [Rhizocola hellebori]|uniref:Nucleotidyl transferase AbiEii/AbiGii toxin family protein n=1 Tax=Rhizocola hellebori TaxID=1392758 RepID=A0A8J3QD82_9ACTN|nr:nucleotidyl transferase AbiEii/AbiGii toxin family protein [Rhizocola hellebori]GIH07892.1 hypothetical protein Rhe02_59590 [Rhizocola hellebori]
MLVADISGDFEIHLTAVYGDELEGFARDHGWKFSHIELDRGVWKSQPMVSVRRRGTLDELWEMMRIWRGMLIDAAAQIVRVKIEAAPSNEGVPQTDGDAGGEPQGRYFEHHVKLVLSDAATDRLAALAQLIAPHGARLSRNARRQRPDGRHERFVTQRCHRVGRVTARQELDALLEALRMDGQDIAEIEEEYVVYDSALRLDEGWLDEQPSQDHVSHEFDMRPAPPPHAGFPSTYRPLPADPQIRQPAVFDPALKQFVNAYRAGEPRFVDEQTGNRWRQARWDAMTHLLRLIAAGPWAKHLVLRGSVPLRVWLGDAAREPGDLDFVVTPSAMMMEDRAAGRMLDGIVAAVREHPGGGLRADSVAAEDIWTYERAPGRRLTFAFSTPQVPHGSVQLDFVFNETLPVAPIPIRIPPLHDPIATAPPELALAWKILWLETDKYPQGKDLYDATLLAEFTPISLTLVREVLRRELGAEADSFTAASVLRWRFEWDSFLQEYPGVRGHPTTWQHRLVLALGRSFSRHANQAGD